MSELTDALLLPLDTIDDDASTTTGGAIRGDDTRLTGVDVVRACLEHSQLVLMGSVNAGPMATRKALYKSATRLLQDDHEQPAGGLLAQQALLRPELWGVQSVPSSPDPPPGPQLSRQQRERAIGVAEIVHAIFAGTTNSTDLEDIARIESFVNIVQQGPS